MAEGGIARQCVREDDDDCVCTPTSAGKTTLCRVTNDAGTCTGTRTCGPGGLAICNAPTPVPETCNDRDDCDLATDEGLCDDGIPCTRDACTGDGTCRGVWACNDQNPRTFDFPNPFALPPFIPCCFNEPQDAPCSDGDPATIGDASVNGTCVPGPRCGDANCEKAWRETCATCPVDCGPCPPIETNCTDAWDDDGDGNIDCNDGDCFTVPPCNGATCRSDVDVACGSRLHDEIASGNDVVGTTGTACSSRSLTSKDRVYRFFARTTRTVAFDVLDGGTSDFRIYVLDNVCNPTACVRAASDTSGSGSVGLSNVSTVAGRTYYVVVEQSWGSDSYDLRVTCN